MSIRYVPTVTPSTSEELPKYVKKELNSVSDAINNQADGHIEKTHVEPPRPREGDIRYADGTNWNPGQGENLYYFDGTVWRAYAGGSGAGDFAQLADTTNQIVSAINTAQGITWNTTAYSQGISIDSTDTSKIYFTHSGKYYIDFSCLLHSTSANNKDVWIYPAINGTTIAGAGIHHTLATNNHKRTLSKSGMFDITAGDYLQAMWAVDDLDLDLHPEPSTSFAPATPSATLSIIQVSQ